MEQEKYISMFMQFIESERIKIDIDKWKKGEEIKKDPGQEYIIEWIEKNAAWFRDAWENSKCKFCKHVLWCGYKVEKECSGFSFQ
jgi:hypothetical protein